ncbi:hypothetical protein Sjap_012086 [Stephania japonica]|uniref:Uncharacterized protein n=1 Tax=Stephania japonica TaxID=461633 RepID=A0AAP0NXY3_9MAGN
MEDGGIIPYLAGEENEPEDVKQDPAAKKEGVSTSKTLAATLDGDQGEQGDHQIDQGHAVEQCPKRTHQRAPDLEDPRQGRQKGGILIPHPSIAQGSLKSEERRKMAAAAAAATSQASTESKSQSQSWEYEDLKRSVLESTDSALRSARALQQNSSTHLRTFKDFIPQLKSHYHSYEHAFFNTFKDELASAREHPAVAAGVAVMAPLLLLRGPRRFLLRHTLGRLQSEEALFNRADRNVKDLGLSVDLMKKESKKLLERAALAEKEMKHGHQELVSAGNEIQRLAKTVYKIEARVTVKVVFPGWTNHDEITPRFDGRAARDTWQRGIKTSCRCKFDVTDFDYILEWLAASMLSLVKQQRNSLDKGIMKISELGVAV